MTRLLERSLDTCERRVAALAENKEYHQKCAFVRTNVGDRTAKLFSHFLTRVSFLLFQFMPTRVGSLITFFGLALIESLFPLLKLNII